MLGHRRGEGDYIVLGCLLDFFDAGDVEGAAFTDVPGGFRGNDSGARHRVGCGDLDVQPGFVLPLVAPDATHFGMGITGDHVSQVKGQRSKGKRPST
jgi:hypothetical protein